MPERRALLVVPVDPLLHRVDIDEGQHVLAGRQRGAPGQLRQQSAVHRLELPCLFIRVLEVLLAEFAYYLTGQRGLSPASVADSGYEGAGAGMLVPVRKAASGELDADTKTRNAPCATGANAALR